MINPPDFAPPKKTFGPHNRVSTATRNSLGRHFVRDLQGLWEEQGEAVLRRVAFHNPEKVLAAMVQLMPTQVENVTPTDGMSDERLALLLEVAERMAALRSHGNTADGGRGIIDLHAGQVEEGGGGPPALGPSGGGYVVVHTAAEPEKRLLNFSADPVKIGSVEEDVDPASLF